MKNERRARLKSLGKLRPNNKTKPKSPDLIGQLHIQLHTLKAIVAHIKKSDAAEVACNIAAWNNLDEYGRYLT